MKKYLLLTACMLFMAIYVNAQRYAVIDSKYILEKLPEYKESQTRLDQYSAQWQQEIETKQAALDKMYKDYDAEQVMLSEELKKKREDELFNKEKEVRDLQKKRFGFEGDLFKERQKLIKPIQDKVYNAIKTVAEKAGLGFILDKSGQVSILYANSKYDKSDDVLVYLGYKK